MITQERLKELLLYDPDTGTFKWRKSRGGKAVAGSAAGTINHHGYRTICLDGKPHQASHVAHCYMTGVWPPEQMDHRNGDRSDDRWVNLRQATGTENLRNRRAMRNNKCGLKGTFWCNQSQRWRASISKDGEQLHLGSFTTKEAAHEAYRVAAGELHGDFARAE